MNFGWIRPFFQRAQREMVKHAPVLLMATGTTCSVAAVISAAKAYPEADEAFYEAKIDKMDAAGVFYDTMEARKKPPRLNPIEWIRSGGKYYIPAILLEMMALGCFWGAHGIDAKRQAVLAGLLSTAQEALNEYQQKVKEMIGKDAEKEVRNAIAQDRIDANPPPTTTVILPDSADMWWIIDGQYFMNSYSGIKDAQNEANHYMLQHMYLSQAELYWFLDPMHKWLKTDNNEGCVGWNLDRLLVLDLNYGKDPNNRPVGTISYKDKDGFAYPPGPGFSAGL